MGPWDRNQGFVHITKARKHHRVTLIMWKGLPLWGKPFGFEPPLQGSHVQQYMSITFWNCLTVSDWPSLILFTADRMDSICASDRHACIDVDSHATPRKVVLRSGESTLFLAFSRNPNPFMSAKMTSRCRTANWCNWARITNRRYSSFMWIHWRRRGARVASTHFVKVRGNNARPNGRTWYWYALPPKGLASLTRALSLSMRLKFILNAPAQQKSGVCTCLRCLCVKRFPFVVVVAGKGLSRGCWFADSSVVVCSDVLGSQSQSWTLRQT